MGEELEAVTQIVRDRGECDVVINFFDVDIVTSLSICKFIILRTLLTECGCKLIFSNVSAATKNIFRISGLESIFDFVDDKFVALASIQSSN